MGNPYQTAAEILKSTSDHSGENEIDREHRFQSIAIYGDGIRKEGSSGMHFHLENETGSGDITIFQVFPGIELVYNDIHMLYCNLQQKPLEDVIEINHCRQGRCEYSLDGRTFGYIGAGDLAVCALDSKKHESYFPLYHYHGIMITIYLKQITEDMRTILGMLSIDLAHIRSVFRDEECCLIRANEMIEHIFSELYTVREHIRQGYLKVKVLELLLMLTEINAEKGKTDRMYFSKSQTCAVKAIHDFILEHMEMHFTLEELAQRFELSETSMKKCFKGIYGTSIYAYLRTCRLQMAQKLLLGEELSITEIAARVGYENPNKFSSAFKTEFGISPTEYRKVVQMDRKPPL